jgi:hypothetical protein
MAQKDRDLFIYLNGRPVSLSELGDAADGPIAEALQVIVDKGLAGDWPPGTPWYHIFQPNCFSVGKSPAEESEHLQVLYKAFKDYEAQCVEWSTNGEITAEQREELERRFRAYEAMDKLTRNE